MRLQVGGDLADAVLLRVEHHHLHPRLDAGDDLLTVGDVRIDESDLAPAVRVVMEVGARKERVSPQGVQDAGMAVLGMVSRVRLVVRQGRFMVPVGHRSGGGNGCGVEHETRLQGHDQRRSPGTRSRCRFALLLPFPFRRLVEQSHVNPSLKVPENTESMLRAERN